MCKTYHRRVTNKMKKIIAGLTGLALIASAEAADLNVKLAPQITNFGNAVHTEFTVSDFYGKGIIEAGLEKDIGSNKVPNAKLQAVHFLPKHFSLGSLVRLGLNENANADEFLYVSASAGYNFAHGKANVSLGPQANIPIKEGRFGKPEFGATIYGDYQVLDGLRVYAVGSASKGFKLARLGASASLPKLYK